MKKLLRKIQIIALYITIGELIVLGILYGLYLTNTFELQNFISLTLIGYITLAFIIANIVLLWIALFFVYFNRQRNDIKTGDIIGEGIEASYKFAALGYIIVDEEDNIIYISETLKARGIKALNHNVYSWKSELKDLEKSNKDYEIINFDGLFFKVSYLKENKLFLFQDVTEYESDFIRFQKNAACIGIIQIDNYLDIVNNNEEINEIIPSIKSKINEYAKRFKLVLRGYKNDTYLVICRNEDLMEMKKDGFSLLSQVRNLTLKSDVKTSLSIGFAYDFPTFNQLNDMASNAISVAMSRGGDQAVIAQLNHELIFIGGKTEASESHNKVKVKADSNALLNYIEQNDNILIMGHSMMDMDALGSCLGVQALCEYKKKKSKIIYDPNLTEKKTRGAIQTEFSPSELKENFISIDDANKQADGSTLLIICDVNNPDQFMSKDIVEKTDKIIIIDHHRRGDKFIENIIFQVIDTSASSASEIVVELIKFGSKYPPIKINERSATIMLSGISLDTNFFKSKTTGSRTFEACMVLKDYGADSQKADLLLKDEYEEFAKVTSLTSQVESYSYGIVYCVGSNTEIYDAATLAKAANQCIGLKEIEAAFVIGKVAGDMIGISCRSNGKINVQIVAEKLGGGGHFNASAATFMNLSIEKVKELLINALDSLKNDIVIKEE